MNAEQKQRLQMDRRAQGWLAEHPDVVASTPQLSQQTEAFNAVVAELSASASGQDSHFRASMGATAEASRLRRVLIVDQMQSIATVAKVTVPDVVRMTAALRMPRQGIDAEGLLTAADAMATEAQRYQDVLVQQALPVDFVAQLRAAAGAYRQVIDSRGQFRAQRHGATESVDVLDRRARKLLTTISVLVTRALRDNPAALAEWEQLRRVRKVVPVTPADAEPETPDAPADVPVALPATAATTPAEQQKAA